METAFLLSLLFIFYAYGGYPLILWIWARLKKRRTPALTQWPRVAVLMAAHNEESFIGSTLQAVLNSSYPQELFRIWVMSDKSTDRTDEIVRSFDPQRVTLVSIPNQQGKNAALRNHFHLADGEILVLMDANVIIPPESIKNLVRHFSNPRIGSVVGSKVLIKALTSVSQGDALYWRYEAKLRSLGSQTGASCVGIDGAFYAIRKEIFDLNFPDHLPEDYAICCRVFEKGFINVYDPEAVFFESPAINMRVEFFRKIRVIVRGIVGFFAFGNLLNPISHPVFFFQNFSHRFCRWLVPFFLISLFLSSAMSSVLWIRILFYLQSGFYCAAMLGWILKLFRKKSIFTSIPFYFSAMNSAALVSWFLLFKKFETWTPPQREAVPPDGFSLKNSSLRN